MIVYIGVTLHGVNHIICFVHTFKTQTNHYSQDTHIDTHTHGQAYIPLLYIVEYRIRVTAVI